MNGLIKKTGHWGYKMLKTNPTYRGYNPIYNCFFWSQLAEMIYAKTKHVMK